MAEISDGNESDLGVSQIQDTDIQTRGKAKSKTVKASGDNFVKRTESGSLYIT